MKKPLPIPPTSENVIAALVVAARQLGIPPQRLIRGDRERTDDPRVLKARAFAAVILTKTFGYSTQQVASIFNYSSHSPVVGLIKGFDVTGFLKPGVTPEQFAIFVLAELGAAMAQQELAHAG